MKKLWPLGLVIGVFLLYSHWRSNRAEKVVGKSVIELPDNGGELRFLAFGDYGTGGSDHLKVIDLAEKLCQSRSINALLLLGDNIYMDGVPSPDHPLWQSIIEKPFSKPCLSKLPLFPVLGNHDYKGNPNAQIEYSLINKRWFLPKRFYSVVSSDLLEIVAMDTNIVDFCLDEESCMLDYILDRLSQSKARWKIAIGHHPVISSSSKHDAGLQGRLLKPVLCKFDAYIAGHSHHLEHIKPEDCHGELFISGAGGASLYQPKPGLDSSNFAKAEFGVLEVTVTRLNLSYRFVNVDGQELYQYSNLYLAQKTDLK